jgi:hypothetical protein
MAWHFRPLTRQPVRSGAAAAPPRTMPRTSHSAAPFARTSSLVAATLARLPQPPRAAHAAGGAQPTAADLLFYHMRSRRRPRRRPQAGRAAAATCPLPGCRPRQLARGSQMPPQMVLQQGRRRALFRTSPLRAVRRRERGGDNRSGGGMDDSEPWRSSPRRSNPRPRRQPPRPLRTRL